MHGASLSLEAAVHKLKKKRHFDPAIVLSTSNGVESIGPVNERWELGSITKVFTALLLAHLHQSGRVAMNEPIAARFPGNLKLPKGFEKITFENLATHQSGLPRLPPGMKLFGKDAMVDPYSVFDEERIYHAIEETKLKSNPGSGAPRYSNFGFGLLGFTLERVMNQSYEDLLMQEIISPLGLSSATFDDDELHQGHSGKKPVGPWHLGRFKAMGGLRMSAVDLSNFLSASQNHDHPLAPAFRESLKVRFRGKKLSMGLAWMYLDKERVLGHGGGTLGAMTEAYINLTSQSHVVLFGDGNPGTMKTALRLIK